MITCNIIGGLGNQLFQIFATISYALKYKQVFCFTDKIMTGKRPMYWTNFLSTLKLFTILREIKNVKIVQESTYYSVVPISYQNSMLSGYFQSEKYFKEYYESICRMIRLEEQKEKIRDQTSIDYINTISMHFRQGDYLLLPDHYLILSYNYYKNSLDYILKERKDERKDERKEKIEDSHVLFFCEDGDLPQVIDIIKQLKEAYPQVEFSRAPTDLEDWQQLLMMSCCQHNIIANSTFSWWGAYFNSNLGKIVCAPAEWFGKKIDIKMEELLPEEWITIAITLAVVIPT